MLEKWKDIKGYEGNYQVSNKGRIYSQFRGGVFKKVNIRCDGYNIVTLSKNNKSKTHYIHRLVMEHFNATEDKELHVNHIDFNKDNNHISNLEWVTVEDNNKYSYDAGRYFNNKYQEIEVIYNNGDVKVYPSIVQASKNIGCHRDTIYLYWDRGYSPRLQELGIKKINKLEWKRTY